ncbi:MAG: PDDEXK nuclease domain-containing protein, partial [Bacteroidota bacterium]
MSKQLSKDQQNLFNEVRSMIEEARLKVSQTINAGLTILYWNIGKRINEEVLRHKRAEYGKEIVVTLSRQLIREYGNNFNEKNLRRMVQFSKLFSDFEIVVTLSRQLSWSHFIVIIPLKTELERSFYAEMCRVENWSVRTLRSKIQSMLFERTAISQKPEELAKKELETLREKDQLSPDLVFQNPYVLDFLGLKDTFLEKDLEQAILNKLEHFLLELGSGFAFAERQKRMVIDGNDYKLDLLFYHRKLRRLVAIDLKIGKFKAEYKGQMELYLRWLEKNEMEEGEEQPIGLILCAEGNHEQIELLQLDKTNIKVGQYITRFLLEDFTNSFNFFFNKSLGRNLVMYCPTLIL